MKSKLSLSRMGMRGSLALIIVGTLILTFGIFIDSNSRKLPENAGETTAVIVKFISNENNEIQSTTTLVSYVVKGKIYENIPLGQYQASWHTGDEIDILYSIDAPEIIWTKTMVYSGYLFMLLSVPFLTIGIYKIIQFARMKAKSRKSDNSTEDYDEENEMDVESGFKFRISTVIIPFAAGIPFTALGVLLYLLKVNEFLTILITALGLLALFAGTIALINFGRKKTKNKL